MTCIATVHSYLCLLYTSDSTLHDKRLAHVMAAGSVRPVPVSYTHLDVYKRQVIFCTCKCDGAQHLWGTDRRLWGRDLGRCRSCLLYTSDKLGRRISTAIGSGSYAIYLIGLALAFNAGTNGGYQIAYICAKMCIRDRDHIVREVS